MRPDELTEFRKWISYDTDTELVIAAFNAAPLDGEPTSCGQRLRRLLARFLDDYEGELGTSIALVPRWRKLGAGAWRQSLLDEIADWQESDYETFLSDETVRTVGWKRLSLEIKETLLTRWVELSTDTLYELTAQKMPDLLADAIRWGGIGEAVEADRAGSQKISLFGELLLGRLVHLPALLDLVHQLVLLASLGALIDLGAWAVDCDREAFALFVEQRCVVAADQFEGRGVGRGKRCDVKHGVSPSGC